MKNKEKQIDSELELLQAKVFNNIEDGTLLVVNVGNDDVPSTPSDLERVSESLNNLFEGVKGLKVLVCPHLVDVEAIPLPTLREIESKVVNSFHDDESVIMGLDLLGNME
jgi:hypothetical protein